MLAGIVAGVLYAPQPGEKTRKNWKNQSTKSKKYYSRSQYGEGHSIELIDKIKYKFEKQLDRINSALKSSKLAAAKAKEEEASNLDY